MKQLIDLAAAAARLSPERRRLVEKLLAEKGIDPSRLPIQRRPELAAPVPLSFAQQRLWFLEQLAPGQTVFHLQAVVRLEGVLDLRALAESFQRLADRHEALRTVFETDAAGDPVQRVLDRVEIPLPLLDLSRFDDDRAVDRIQDMARWSASRPFDLRRGPLLRAVALRLAPESHALVVTLHHIVGDGWSMGLLIFEMSHLYEAVSQGESPQLPRLEVQYPDFAAWQRQWLGGSMLEQKIAARVEQLQGIPTVLDLPTPCDRPDRPSGVGEARQYEVDRGVVELARKGHKGTTPFMVLAAVLSTLLSRLTGQEQFALGFPSAGRGRTEVQPLIGFFINTLVLCCDLRGNPTFDELVERIRLAALDAYAGQDVPFERLVDELGGDRDLSRSPIFQVLLNMLDLEAGRPKPASLGELQLQGLENQQPKAKFDLALHVLRVTETGAQVNMVYAVDLFDPVWIERFVERFQRLCRVLPADPERHIGSVGWLSRGERHQLLVEWNDTIRPPIVQDFVRAIDQQSRRSAEAVAFSYHCESDGVGETWTYDELRTRGTALAHRLRALGAGPDRVVAVLAERSPVTHAALWGILRAGAGYLAIDPKFPLERQRTMLADADAQWLLASGGQRSRATELGPPVLDLETLTRVEEGDDALELPWDADPANLAYVVFTSGSSGRPKGIAASRADVGNHLSTVLQTIDLGADDRVLQITGLGFDGSVRGSFGALLAGARLEILEESEAMDPRILVERLHRDRISTILAVVPTVLAAMLDEAGSRGLRLPDLRRIFVAGEAFPVSLWRRAREVLSPQARLYNQYGPTECTLTSTLQPVGLIPSPPDSEGTRAAPAEVAEGVLLAGRPIGNQTLRVLGRRLEARPSESVGELCIGGEGLARGYLGRPGLTAASFVPDPHGNRPGGRLYRTGDLGRLDRSGRLRVLGRRDGQVKLRGQRLELGEVEAVLAEHPGVRHAAVRLWRAQPRTTENGDRNAVSDGLASARLVAYFEAASGTGSEVLEGLEGLLREHLRQRLPESLQPSRILGLDPLPRTHNGKIDRRSLPFPESLHGEGEGASLQGVTEELLAGIWRELLDVGSVGREDHFFDLGGHSLLATRVASRIGTVFGIELPLRAIFEAPVLHELALRIETVRRATAGHRTPPLEPLPRPEHIPLALAQERLWLLHQLDPASHAFNLRTALRARGPLEPTVLAEALQVLVRRHESLRTHFGEISGQPAQIVEAVDEVRVPLPRVDLRGLEASQRAVELRRVIVAESRRAFDLRRGPVLRSLLVLLAADEHAIVLTLHHIVGDAWSLGVLARELAELYRSGIAGERARLAPMAIQYPDFALWQRSWLSGEVLDSQIDYWRRQLEDAPATELPTDLRRPEKQSFRGERLDFSLPTLVAQALRELSQEEGTTLFMTLLAGFDVLLARTLQQDDIVVGTHIANRNRTETEGLIGFFINSLVLRTDLSGDPTGREVVRRARRTCLDAYAHQDLPFARVVREVSPERRPGRNPFFQLMLVLQNAPTEKVGQRMQASQLALSPLSTAGQTAKFDLTLFLFERGEELGGHFEYSTDLFREDSIRRLGERLASVLQGLAEDPDQPISQLSLGADATVQALANAFTDDLL